MLKKTITYKDLDGNDITEDFYFNLSKAEIAEMELGKEGGFSKYLEQLIASEDAAAIIATFKKILVSAIGRRSEDGKRFIKSDEIANEFLQSDAYSTLFMNLITEEDSAAEFVTGILPADMPDVKPTETVELPEKAKDDRPAYVRENRDPTKEELQNMTVEEMQEAFKRKNLRSVE